LENRVYYGQYSLKHWVNLILKQNITLPEYQRYFVWNEGKVATLIDAFRRKQFIPPVTIGAFKIGDTSQNLILDGQQRLTSILLAFLDLYPDEKIYKKTLETFFSENDDDEPAEKLDNIFEWTFQKLTEKGGSKQEILKKIQDGNYKKTNLGIGESFFEENFLGFSYLIPATNNEKTQQKYYSSVFRSINIQGETLLPQESRASLYFLDKDLTQFFTKKFTQNFAVKAFGSETKLDFVRFLSLLSQYKNDGGADGLARSYKPKMEQYYEEYIYSSINDSDSRYGRFSEIFPGKKYSTRLESLQRALDQINVGEKMPSIIDLDMYFFGLVFAIVFEGKALEVDKIDDLKRSIDLKIAEFKKDLQHIRSPGHLKYLRSRVDESIKIYKKYAQNHAQ
jgi:uncharacterized protein with ParB-like and HNH nuclease domain